MGDFNGILKYEFTLIKGETASGKTTLANKLYNTILETEHNKGKVALFIVKDIYEKSKAINSLKEHNLKGSKIVTYDEFMEMNFITYIKYKNSSSGKVKLINEEVIFYVIKDIVNRKKTIESEFLNLIISVNELASIIYKIYKFAMKEWGEFNRVPYSFYKENIKGITEKNIDSIKEIIEEYRSRLNASDLYDYERINVIYREEINANEGFIKNINNYKCIILDDFQEAKENIMSFLKILSEDKTKLVAFYNEDKILKDTKNNYNYINLFMQDKNKYKILNLKECKTLSIENLNNAKKIIDLIDKDLDIKVKYPLIEFKKAQTKDRGFLKNQIDIIKKINNNDLQYKDIVILSNKKNSLTIEIKRYILGLNKINNENTIDKINASIIYNHNGDVEKHRVIDEKNKFIKVIEYEKKISFIENSYFKNLITYAYLCGKTKIINIELNDICELLVKYLDISYSQGKILAKYHINTEKYNIKFIQTYLSEDIIKRYLKFKEKLEELRRLDIRLDKFFFHVITQVLGEPRDEIDKKVINKLLSTSYDFMSVVDFRDKNDINDDIIAFLLDNNFDIFSYMSADIFKRTEKNTRIFIMDYKEFQKYSIIADYIIVDGRNIGYDVQSNDVNYEKRLAISLLLRCRKKIYINLYENNHTSEDILKKIKKIIE